MVIPCTYIKHETQCDLKTISNSKCNIDNKVLKRIKNEVKKGNVKKIDFEMG